MAYGTSIRAPNRAPQKRSQGSHGSRRRRNSHGRKRRTRKSRATTKYNVADIVKSYLISISILFGTIFLYPPLALFVYFPIGVYLTRFVSNRVQIWEFAANLDRVYAEKVKFLVLWPISVPAIAFKIFVVKLL